MLQRFERAIRLRGDQPIPIGALAREIGTSLRTLNAVCGEAYGMGAQRHLQVLRLERVRVDILAGGSTVTEIATRYGFWNFGWFAKKYREHFGELPSQTRAVSRRAGRGGGRGRRT